ncbi:MAG: hypothetical protein WEC99_04000 [Halofilum sp. (in: g-proteobacteria)]
MRKEQPRADASEWGHVYAYFEAVCDQLTRPWVTDRDPPPQSTKDTAASVLFHLLTSRDFTYLTRKRAEPYRAATEARFAQAIQAGGPVNLYFDIGGGYRATLEPERFPLAFTPRLGELLVLSQIGSFIERAQPRSPVPIRFTLVVDNLCAYYVNGISLTYTERYCERLREMLSHFEIDLDLLVESEHRSFEEYREVFEGALAKEPAPDAITPPAHGNVERFLGRRVDKETALHQLARYAAGGATTDAGLEYIIDGVRLTQRATPHTLAFRPFPGGDVRIQCGEVGLAVGTNDRIRPLLLTSENYAHYRKEQVDVADWRIPHVANIDLLYA